MSNFSDQNINQMSMLDLFKMEINSQCEQIKTSMDLLIDSKVDQETIVSLSRAFHSIKGAASIVDLKSIVTLTKAIESALSKFSQNPSNPEWLHDILRNAIIIFSDVGSQKTEDIMNWIESNHSQITELTTSIFSLSEKEKDYSELPSTDLFEQDDYKKNDIISTDISQLSMFSIFKEDAEHHSSLLTDNLLNLEKNPNDINSIESSMRSTHSIKGAARLIELHQIVELAHAMEDILQLSQKNNIAINSDQIDILLESTDFLKDLIQLDDNTYQSWLSQNEDRYAQLNSSLNKAATSTGAPKAKSAVVVEDKAPSNESQKNKIPPPKDSDRSKKENEPASAERMIKVSGSSLNRMMGLAGEMLAEARWIPTLLKQGYAIKRNQESIKKILDSIRSRTEKLNLDADPQLEKYYTDLKSQYHTSQQQLSEFLEDIEIHTRKSDHISHMLHREIIANRMQPFQQAAKFFPRMVRDLAKRLNKEVSIDIIGSKVMVDRDVLEKIETPLIHLITNAIDHGIEPVEQRINAAKPASGVIRLEAKNNFGVLQITIADDGMGVDLERLRNIIIERKLAPRKIVEKLSEQELTEFLFLPNFSTKTTSTHISGRGVGLDAVQDAIRNIRGSITLTTIPGEGTIFELQLPLTLSTTKCLITRINNENYAFPLVHIDHVQKITRSAIIEGEDSQYFMHDNHKVFVVSAHQPLEIKQYSHTGDELNVIILQNIARKYGVIVDQFIGVRNLLIQPLNPDVGKLRSISATAIDNDGCPILIMDCRDLISSIDHIISRDTLKKIDSVASSSSGQEQNRKKILVVDDSRTVREVEKKILSQKGYNVLTAVDGVDAWQKANNDTFDLIITDIDMPNMDGIELILQIKEDDSLKSIPIIVVSYKNREEDRNQGLDAGADYYLTKGSFREQKLLDAVYDLIGNPQIDDT